MVTLTAYGTFKPDAIEAGFAACRKVREPSRLEPGCDRYDFFQSTDDPASFVFVEEWRSKADLDLHFEQEPFKEFFASMSELVIAPPEIRIFESSLLS